MSYNILVTGTFNKEKVCKGITLLNKSNNTVFPNAKDLLEMLATVIPVEFVNAMNTPEFNKLFDTLLSEPSLRDFKFKHPVFSIELRFEYFYQ